MVRWDRIPCPRGEIENPITNSNGRRGPNEDQIYPIWDRYSFASCAVEQKKKVDRFLIRAARPIDKYLSHLCTGQVVGLGISSGPQVHFYVIHLDTDTDTCCIDMWMATGSVTTCSRRRLIPNKCLHIC